MKVCPSCKKESVSDTECTHCSILFAKWEARHREMANQETFANDTLQTGSPEPVADAVETKLSMTRVAGILLVGLAAAWFFFPSSDEKRVLHVFRGYHDAIAAGDQKGLDRLFIARSGQTAGAATSAIHDSKPELVKVEKVLVAQDAATVRASEMIDGDPVVETVDLKKEHGEWKIADVSWNAPSSRSDDYRTAFGGRSVPELQHALMTADLQTRFLILDDLVNRGARKDALHTLNEMLRDRSGGPRHKEYASWNSEVRSLLKRINGPVTFARDEANHVEKGNAMLACEEWEIDLRDDSLFTNGGFYAGPGIIDGLSRSTAGGNPAAISAPRYVLKIEGGSLRDSVEKRFEGQNHSGDQSWNDVLIASGLGRGTYRVSMRVEAATLTPDGAPKQHLCQMANLEVEKR